MALLVVLFALGLSDGQPPTPVPSPLPAVTAAAGTPTTLQTASPIDQSAMNMAPGDVAVQTMVVPPHQISVERYRVIVVSQSPGDVMSTHLIITVTTTGSSCLQGDGSVLYTGLVDAAVCDAPTDGPNGAVPDTLCLRGELPLDSGNDVQGGTISLRLAVAS